MQRLYKRRISDKKGIKRSSLFILRGQEAGYGVGDLNNTAIVKNNYYNISDIDNNYYSYDDSDSFIDY